MQRQQQRCCVHDHGVSTVRGEQQAVIDEEKTLWAAVTSGGPPADRLAQAMGGPHHSVALLFTDQS